MAAKLLALYRQPKDQAAFDTRYFNGHLDLVRKLPHLRRLEVSRGIGTDAPYYLATEMYFDSVEEMKACLRSREAGAAVRDVMEFAADLVTIVQVDTIVSDNVS